MHRDIIRRAGITSDVTQVNGKAFDFIIAGGGLAGLALAGRLSSSPTRPSSSLRPAAMDQTTPTTLTFLVSGG
jgi:NADH dehydrogenase FAD-containing subunit